jgi:PTH1 family peptidyl-tRNA hydrolase
VVQDDIDMALGKVRSRKSGSAGGHNGIRSIIETLGTQEFRRVKIGVGHPGSKEQVVGHVLSPFTMEELLEVEVAVAEAADRVLVLAGEAARQRGTGP